MYIAFDPGTTTGYATFDIHGNVKDMGQIHGGVEGVAQWLADHDEAYSTMIIEDYKITPHEASFNVGRDLMAVQVLGMLKGWATGRKINVVVQSRQVKKIGQTYGGYKFKGRHKDSHQWDAYYHGMYYLVSKRIRLPRGMEPLGGKKETGAERSKDK